MAPARWYASDGVGLNKKYDAPGPVHHAGASRPLFGGLRRRRLVLIVAAVTVLYFFVKNIPTDVPPVGQRYSSRFGSLAPGHVQAQYGFFQSHDTAKKKNTEQGYEGSILFQHLAATLRPHMSWFNSHNVLFALPDLSSTSNMVPIACQMARYNRSSVHVALLGRQNIQVQDIMRMHGLSADECPVFWHDARPDHVAESSDHRIEDSIQSGFAHCCNALRPQAVLMDDTAYSNPALGQLLKAVAIATGVSLIPIPAQGQTSLSWITTLDGDSLLNLKEIEIEIVIQAYPESAGPLMRLLRSISSADYHGLPLPGLTVELPAEVDPFILRHLEWFRWPPGSPPSESRLTLRRRIDRKRPTVSDASLHTIQSYYPRTTTKSHVLILSPDVELSAGYLHYLMLVLLEYRYGRANMDLGGSLFGIALELPETRLNGESPFLHQISVSENNRFVLSQTPNCNAALIMGDKWGDLRTLLTSRLVRDPELTLTSDSAASITKQHPRWLREALDLMQTQRLYMLYPAFAIDRNMKLATVHRELRHPPEEYTQPDTNTDRKGSKNFPADDIMHNDVLTGNVDLSAGNDNAAPVSPSLPMQAILLPDSKTGQQILPKLTDMPLFTFSGESTDWTESHTAAKEFADSFSLHQGGCVSLEERKMTNVGSIASLFCEPG